MRIALAVVVVASCSRAAEPPPAQPAQPAPVAATSSPDDARAKAIEEVRAKGGDPGDCHYDGSNIYGGDIECDHAGYKLAGGGATDPKFDGDYASGSLGSGSDGREYGHGSGTGEGFGSGGGSSGTAMRPRGPVPTLHLGPPTVGAGGLDPAIVRRYLKRNIMKLQYCYERQLIAKPGLAGTVVATFTIGADGVVSRVAADGVDPEVSSCMAMIIRDLAFPRGKQSFDVRYPIEVKPK